MWSHNIGGSTCTIACLSPDGTVYVGSSPRKIYDEKGSRLHAFKDGKKIWDVKFDGEIYAMKIKGAPKVAQVIIDSQDDEKNIVGKPKIDDSTADGWVIIGGIKVPKKS